jgi:hypothetical protein
MLFDFHHNHIISLSMDGLSEKMVLVRKYYFVVGKKIKEM